MGAGLRGILPRVPAARTSLRVAGDHSRRSARPSSPLRMTGARAFDAPPPGFGAHYGHLIRLLAAIPGGLTCDARATGYGITISPLHFAVTCRHSATLLRQAA